MEIQYKKIFVALDGSSAQSDVLNRAIDIAEKNKAQLLLGHVVESAPFEASGLNFDMLSDEARHRLESDLADELQRIRQSEAIPSFELEVCVGRINYSLTTQFIEPFQPDLIVCGARGISSLKQAFIGSVSTHLIRNATCDVLVVRQGRE